jgi:hypothetical protein
MRQMGDMKNVHTEEPNVLGAKATWRPGFVQHWTGYKKTRISLSYKLKYGSRALLEKLIVSHLLQKLCAFYVNTNFFNM